MEQKVLKWIDENKEISFERLKKMIQAKSTQGEEKAVQEIVAKILTELNFTVDKWDLDHERLQNHPYFYSNRETFADSPNVVGVLKGTGGGRSIVLNGHVDVVPEGDHNQWTHHPYSGEVVDGKMYGRGSTDMKGGNVALMLAVEAIQAAGIQLKGDVIFHSVVEEESGGAGTLDAILKGYKADAAIIPEPTNMKIFPKQQGSQWFRLKVKGRTAHGGTPYLGVSAIDKAMLVNEHVKALEKVRNERITDPLYDNLPVPIPINIGTIEGGDWPSSVPDDVQFTGRIGVAPGETMEGVQQEMEQWMEKLGEKDDWFKENPVEVEWYGARWLPGEIEIDHPLVESLINNYENIIEEEPIVEASPWGTDGGLLTQVAGIPIGVFGPSTTNLAQYPN